MTGSNRKGAPVRGAPLEFRISPASRDLLGADRSQHDEQQDQAEADHEQYLGDSGSRAGNPAKSQHRGNQRDDEENQRPLEHGALLTCPSLIGSTALPPPGSGPMKLRRSRQPRSAEG